MQKLETSDINSYKPPEEWLNGCICINAKGFLRVKYIILFLRLYFKSCDKCEASMKIKLNEDAKNRLAHP